MRAIILTLVMGFAGLLVGPVCAQQILNGGFEDIHYPLAEYPELPIPVHWGASWGSEMCNIPVGVWTSESNTGTGAVRIETTNCSGPPNYSSRIGSYFDTSQFSLPVLGHPLHARPDQASFYFKYAPVNGDTAFFSILMFSLPDSLSYMDLHWYYTDTISYMQGFVSEEVLEYEQKIVDLEYENESIPQYIEFRFLSSKHGIYSTLLENGQGHAGTTLWIDDIELIYLSTSSEYLLQETEVRIYPNPVADQFQVEVPDKTQIQSVVVFDNYGRAVRTLNPQDRFHPMNNLAPGIYFVRIETEKGSVVKKLVKE